MAVKIDGYRLEFHLDFFYLNGEMYMKVDLPLTFGEEKYTIENAPIKQGKNAKNTKNT